MANKKPNHKINTVNIPNGEILCFKNERWWLTDTKGKETEIRRSKARAILQLSGLLMLSINEEAWEDCCLKD